MDFSSFQLSQLFAHARCEFEALEKKCKAEIKIQSQKQEEKASVREAVLLYCSIQL